MDIKLIIWDLDDTLWQGTLAEGDTVILYEQRAQWIRTLNQHGIISAICSKNNYTSAKQQLERFNLWQEFVFPHIAFTPKGASIEAMLTAMQLRAENVLFIDDNPFHLHETQALLPDIHIMDARLPDCDLLLQTILEQNQHIHKNRIADYRLLETKTADKQTQGLSNEDFLRASNIHISYGINLENLEFKERIVELINRSNQLNYTQSRIDLTHLTDLMLQNTLYESWTVFVWDKYGYYGLVGFAMMERKSNALIHFALSCRVMHMGIENALLQKTSLRFGTPDISHFHQPLPTLTGDWLTEKKYLDPDIRTMIREREKTFIPAHPTIKIMYACMSGGIAFYSKYRDYMDCDGARFEQEQRFLCFSNLRQHPDQVARQVFPHAIVYGAAFDYYDSAWKTMELPLENKSFVNGLFTFCQFFANKSHKLFIILPPEDLPIDCYRPWDGNTRERTAAFNDAWRRIARFFSFITLLDLTSMVTVEDLADAAHYKAQFLPTIAAHLDAWYAPIHEASKTAEIC